VSGITWAEMKMLEALRREQAGRIAAQRAAETQDRRDWIEGIRRRLGLVSEVHQVEWWQVGEDYWRWSCLRPGCPYGDPRYLQAAPLMGRVRAEAREHRRRFRPSAPEPVPGAGLDLTGFVGY
jgi:hypothetical protein